MTDEDLVALLRQYADGRVEQRRLRRAARALPPCLHVEQGRIRCGAPYGAEDVGSHACARCVASRPAWGAYRARKAENRRLLRILVYHAAKPAPAPPPPEPKALLALMDGGGIG